MDIRTSCQQVNHRFWAIGKSQVSKSKSQAGRRNISRDEFQIWFDEHLFFPSFRPNIRGYHTKRMLAVLQQSERSLVSIQTAITVRNETRAGAVSNPDSDLAINIPCSPSSSSKCRAIQLKCLPMLLMDSRCICARNRHRLILLLSGRSIYMLVESILRWRRPRLRRR